jgi:tetratricopeptide (TPR) repeat protein
MVARLRASTSLCMIVRDEERNLASCLTPVRGLFDEIVIVDTGSTDRTREIARQFNAQVFDFAWRDDFSAARNESLRRARGEWVFWLDADDRISERNLPPLRSLFGNLHNGPRAYLMDTESPQGDATAAATLVTHPRLFRRTPGARWKSRVHERLEFEEGSCSAETVFSDVQIEHEGYRDRAKRTAKLRRNLRLLLMQQGENPELDLHTLWHLGLTYMGLGNLNAGKQYLSRLLARDVTEIASVSWVFAVLAALALHEGKTRESLQWVEKGLAACPGDEGLLYAKALALFEQEALDAAAAALGELLRGPPARHAHFGDAAHIREMLAPHLLGTIQLARRDYERAAAIFSELRQAFPAHPSTIYNLGLASIATGKANELREVVTSLRDLPGGDVDGALLMARWHLSRDEFILAEKLIEETVREAPESASAWLLRAEILVGQRAPREAQLAAWRDVLQVQPGNVRAHREVAFLESIVCPMIAQCSPIVAQCMPPNWTSCVSLMPGLVLG